MAKLAPRHLILACRSKERGLAAEKSIRKVVKDANETEVEFMELDLADLKSVERFAAAINKRFKKVDILLNNAGVFGSP